MTMDPQTIAQFRELLEAERLRLTSELAAFASRDPTMRGDWDTTFPAASPGSPPSAHSTQEEQADLREEYETTIAQEQSLESRLEAVVRALERIDQNAFGSCRACRQPIPLERLQANPAAEYDMTHQPRE